MLIRAIVLAALSVTAAAPSFAQDANPLIGTWKFSGKGYVDGQGHNWCLPETQLQFGATTLTTTTFDPPAQSTINVNYLMNGAKVYVSADGDFGSGVYYDILSSGQIEAENIGHCIYNKQ